MSDCENVEVRELLPELMHGTLPPATRGIVESHLGVCRDCAEELDLLRTARRVGSVPVARIDVASIVRALPPPPAVQRVRSGRPGNLFRIAAAISFISLGGISLAVTRSFFDDRGSVPTADSITAAATQPGTKGDPTRNVGPSPVAVPEPAQRGELTVGGGVSDLRTDDLQLLLGELERIEAAPVAEPDHDLGGHGYSGTAHESEGSE